MLSTLLGNYVPTVHCIQTFNDLYNTWYLYILIFYLQKVKTCCCHDYHQVRIFIGYTIFTAMSGMHSHRVLFAMSSYQVNYTSVHLIKGHSHPLAGVCINYIEIH